MPNCSGLGRRSAPDRNRPVGVAAAGCLRSVTILGAAVLSALVGANASAQSAGAPAHALRAPLGAQAEPAEPDVPVSAFHTLASAALPGSGQLMTGRHRGAIYAISEALFLTRFLAIHAEGRRERDRYLDLAFTIARGPYDPAARDTAFEYFERMEGFIESGPFDTDPGPALVPPTDERTFNGSIWALARATFFPDPDSIPPTESLEYRRALAFYEDRAVGPNFRWSWRNAGLEQDLFRQSIRQSDEAFRRATRQLGLLLANHLLSALDAFISYRLSQNDRRVELSAAVWPGYRRPAELVAATQVTIRF